MSLISSKYLQCFVPFPFLLEVKSYLCWVIVITLFAVKEVFKIYITVFLPSMFETFFVSCMHGLIISFLGGITKKVTSHFMFVTSHACLSVCAIAFLNY